MPLFGHDRRVTSGHLRTSSGSDGGMARGHLRALRRPTRRTSVRRRGANSGFDRRVSRRHSSRVAGRLCGRPCLVPVHGDSRREMDSRKCLVERFAVEIPHDMSVGNYHRIADLDRYSRRCHPVHTVARLDVKVCVAGDIHGLCDLARQGLRGRSLSTTRRSVSFGRRVQVKTSGRCVGRGRFVSVAPGPHEEEERERDCEMSSGISHNHVGSHDR